MKKILLTCLLVFTLSLSAQITFEHTYDNAATWSYCQGNPGQLMLVKLEVSGERYIKVNRCQKMIGIYDINHALIKNISLANLQTFPSGIQYADFVYFSENLFNMDSKMEFMFINSAGLQMSTIIFNEDLNVLFSDTGAAWIRPNYHQQQYPIYNTSQGAKMILSYNNGDAKVFGLGGTLTTAISKANERFMDENASVVGKAYPNPAIDKTRIDYALPEGVSEGVIVIYDSQSKEVKGFRVDNSFDHLLLSTADLNAGTYFYNLQTEGQTSSGKKIIVIR